MASNRAETLLKTVGVEPGSKAAGGRYQRSIEFRRGVRYWSTALERRSADKFGVQFKGKGADLGSRLERMFISHGFDKQSTQPDQITFCKEIAWLPDGGIDVEGVRAVRREVDAVLNEGDNASRDGSPPKPGSLSGPAVTGDGSLSFREFMLRSPLADADLDLPKREGAWRDVDL